MESNGNSKFLLDPLNYLRASALMVVEEFRECLQNVKNRKLGDLIDGINQFYRNTNHRKQVFSA